MAHLAGGPSAAGLMVVAVGWTVAVLWARRASQATRHWATTFGLLAYAGVIVVSTGLFTVDATGVEADAEARSVSDSLGHLVSPTAAALDQGSAPGGGRDGKYLVTWEDPINLGVQGYGLINELDRRGSMSVSPRAGVSDTRTTGFRWAHIECWSHGTRGR